MAPADALCEGVRVLLTEAADFLAVRGLGVVVGDGPEHVIFAYVDIAWSAQTCLVLAVCLATVGNVLRLSDGTRVDEEETRPTGYEDFEQIADLSLR